MNASIRSLVFSLLAVPFISGLASPELSAQDRLPTMPGYARYQEMAPLYRGAMVSGALNVTWAEDGRTFEYAQDGTRFRYDVARREAVALPAEPEAARGQPEGGRGGSRPARGRQYDSAMSPGQHSSGLLPGPESLHQRFRWQREIAITTDGSEEDRIKYGTASWVYGEELGQSTAMWWSPEGPNSAYYGFDEGPVLDYHLQWIKPKSRAAWTWKPIPRPGPPTPSWISSYTTWPRGPPPRSTCGMASRSPTMWSATTSTGSSGPPTGRAVHSPHQPAPEHPRVCTACDPGTGSCRVIVREEWPASWVTNSPPRRFLEDENRFLWTSERTGWRNFYLYDMSGELLATVTDHEFEVGNIVRVDEEAGVLYYMARDGDNHMKMQLHRVGLDGSG